MGSAGMCPAPKVGEEAGWYPRPAVQREEGGCAEEPPRHPHPREPSQGAMESCCLLGTKREMHLQPRLSFSLQVARELQPSVVWIGDTEKTFYKKVPSTERMVRASRSFSIWPFLSPPPEGTLNQGLSPPFKNIFFKGERE